MLFIAFAESSNQVVVECQSHPAYKNALEWFLDTIETYFKHGQNLAKLQKDHTASIFDDDPVLNRTSGEMRTLLERFANGKSLDGVFDAISKLWEDANNDEELRHWWDRVDKFVRKVRTFCALSTSHAHDAPIT